LFQKYKKISLYIFAILILIVVAVICVTILMQAPERVDEKELKEYVIAYLSKYRELVEENFHLVHDIEHVFFKYNNYPLAVNH